MSFYNFDKRVKELRGGEIKIEERNKFERSSCFRGGIAIC